MAPRLIALDMDGTLLDDNSQVPEEFWPLLRHAQEQGVAIAPASGRQLATLQEMFASEHTGVDVEPTSYIAENGTVVFHDGKIVSTTVIDKETVQRVLEARTQISADSDFVLCTPEMAYLLDSTPESTREQVRNYYRATTYVGDLDAVAAEHDIIKIAIYCAAGTEEHVAPAMYAAVPDQDVAISGAVWLDVMARGANKGVALTNMARALDIPMSDTVAFGDFLNDYELLDAAGTAVAMENAHTKLKAIADRIAPPNTEAGVITVLGEMLGLKA